MLVMLTTSEVIRRSKTVLESYYGAQFRALMLYGSMVRNQADDASDIDLLVLLVPPFDYFRELRRIVELLYPLQLESARLISAKPAPCDAFERGELQLYRNAKSEGVVV